MTNSVTVLIVLADALGDRAPPCWSEPEAWFRSDPTQALVGCGRCHAKRECESFAETIHPDAGVWAGRVYDRRGAKP